MDAKILLDAKRRGEELPQEAIESFVAAHSKGDVPDYQMSAFLMAVCCRGMSKTETAALVKALLESGSQLDWSRLDRPTADKHSTGGVGDKISLIALPVAASCGVAVPSLMGRGLGLTGGTVDKLESIPGFNATLERQAFEKCVEKCGIAMSAVSSDIAPSDGRLYALRDVTGTVASIPLITASILSKKLAEGSKTLVFDVKCGSGAFMQNRAEAEELASSLVAGAEAAGRKAFALVSGMDTPLGRAVGNRNEVREALDILKCSPNAPKDVVSLSLELAARMVALAKSVPLEKATAESRKNLENGAAFETFEKMAACQGGNLAALPPPPAGTAFRAQKSGVVSKIDALSIAKASLAAGALRRVKTDKIDPEAGITLAVKQGDEVRKGDALAFVTGCDAALKELSQAFSIEET